MRGEYPVGLHLAMLADRLDVGRLRQERTHDAPVTFGVQAEVVEGIGMTALDDRRLRRAPTS